jgi:hypothetical protein
LGEWNKQANVPVATPLVGDLTAGPSPNWFVLISWISRHGALLLWPRYYLTVLCGVFGGIRDASGPVPFAYAYDDWCFDRAQSNGQGEYLIVFWDHE